MQVVDINTSADNLLEVERLKEGFKNLLSPTATNGTVVIVSDFPPVGNIIGKIDYAIFLNVEKEQGNYYRYMVNDKYHYIDGFVVLIKKINEELKDVSAEMLVKEDGSFDYIDSLRNINYSFQDFCAMHEKIKCCSIYSVNTNSEITARTRYVIVNQELTAEYIVKSVVYQFIEQGKNRVNAFAYENSLFAHDKLIDFIKNLISDTENALKFGILTKNKLDRISTSIKVVNEVYENVGQSLSLISGKAGTGKTLTLMRIIHKHVSEHHHVRFLTFNNLLVFDIKQNLKNFGFYSDNRISIDTVHRFYAKLATRLGIQLMLSEGRVNELINVCETRIDKIIPYYDKYKEENGELFDVHEFLKNLPENLQVKADYDEFREFAEYVRRVKSRTVGDIKTGYINDKRKLLELRIGNNIFVEDYFKVLQLIYEAITDSPTFYDNQNIKSRYDLLAVLYNADKYDSKEEREIPYEAFLDKVKSLKSTTNWSRLLIVDECQDFNVYEKEILFKLRGSENLIVASGGKEQLIRQSQMLDWTRSFGRPVPHTEFKLSQGSFRQKQNIIDFVNAFANHYGYDLALKSVSESKGLGKVIIDIRKKQSIINEDIAIEIKNNGELNKCSPYESAIFLIPSRNYTTKTVHESFVVNEKDYVSKSDVSLNRHTINLAPLEKNGYLCWDGVTEDKYKLKTPFQTETRIIHYESCRGLEAWSCACLSFDQFFQYKYGRNEAKEHLSDDMHYTEEQRRSKFAAIWSIMAFTRPIDTLYIHLEDANSDISKVILSIAEKGKGTIIYK